MELLMTLVPACIIFFVIAWRTWKAYKKGLFVALIQLGLTAVSAVVSFLLTRLLLNPAQVDIFDLGQELVALLPAELFALNPSLKPLVAALPTAVAALLAFTLIFDILRCISCKVLFSLEKKHAFSEKFLTFQGNRAVAIAVGAVTAVICILMDLVLLNGVVSFSGNMLRCAATLTEEEIFGQVADYVDAYDSSPVKNISDSLGCRQVFHALTTSSRNGVPFSVGQELTQLSYVFAELMPLYEMLPSTGNGTVDITQAIEKIDLQTLPQLLTASPHTVEIIANLVVTNKDQLVQSDAMQVVSELTGVTTEQFSTYFDSITVETATEDIKTICNVAAILQEYDLLPGPGQTIEPSDLDNPELIDKVYQEVLKNPSLAEFFDLSFNKKPID